MKREFWAALASAAIFGSVLVPAHGGEDEQLMSWRIGVMLERACQLDISAVKKSDEGDLCTLNLGGNISLAVYNDGEKYGSPSILVDSKGLRVNALTREGLDKLLKRMQMKVQPLIDAMAKKQWEENAAREAKERQNTESLRIRIEKTLIDQD